ncbi:SIMPL domain-containing protein [Novacetimonas pomaceti]|nr:SIMPL domain-containing protein [Novacetimonas pomaceti]
MTDALSPMRASRHHRARRHGPRGLFSLLLAAGMMGPVMSAHAATTTTGSAMTTPDDASTKLMLSATGTVHAPPDRLTAVFFAESTAPTAAGAQGQVNAQVDKAMATMRSITGLTISAESYSVRHQDADPHAGRPAQWVARQTIRVSATDGSILLPLLGRIQSENLALSQLDWSLSRDRRTALLQQAEGLALHELQQRAQAAAGALGLKIARIESVTLNDQEMPRPMPMMMMAARSEVAAPQAPAADQDVTAQADATFVLHP